MPRQSKDTVAVLGIDIGKNTFHLIGLNKRGGIILRLKLSRTQLEAKLANLPPCLVGMEACVGAHHLSRRLKTLGHDPRLMRPSMPRRSSRATRTISAMLRPSLKRFSARLCALLPPRLLSSSISRPYTGCAHAWSASGRRLSTRSALDRGVAVAQGLHRLRAALPGILATRTDLLSPRLLHIIEDLVADWRRLDSASTLFRSKSRR